MNKRERLRQLAERGDEQAACQLHRIRCREDSEYFEKMGLHGRKPFLRLLKRRGQMRFLKRMRPSGRIEGRIEGPRCQSMLINDTVSVTPLETPPKRPHHDPRVWRKDTVHWLRNRRSKGKR